MDEAAVGVLNDAGFWRLIAYAAIGLIGLLGTATLTLGGFLGRAMLATMRGQAKTLESIREKLGEVVTDHEVLEERVDGVERRVDRIEGDYIPREAWGHGGRR